MTERETNIGKLLDAVSEEYGVTLGNLIGRNRYLPLPEARAVVSYLAIKEFNFTLQAAGKITGRNHDTALYHRNKITSDYDLYADVRAHVDKIRDIISPDRVNPYFLMAANLGGYEQ